MIQKSPFNSKKSNKSINSLTTKKKISQEVYIDKNEIICYTFREQMKRIYYFTTNQMEGTIIIEEELEKIEESKIYQMTESSEIQTNAQMKTIGEIVTLVEKTRVKNIAEKTKIKIKDKRNLIELIFLNVPTENIVLNDLDAPDEVQGPETPPTYECVHNLNLLQSVTKFVNSEFSLYGEYFHDLPHFMQARFLATPLRTVIVTIDPTDLEKIKKLKKTSEDHIFKEKQVEDVDKNEEI